jgi:hypothetical protein
MTQAQASSVIERKVAGHLVLGALRWEQLPDIHPDYRVEMKAAAARHEARFGVLYEPPQGKMSVGLLPPGTSTAATRGVSAALWLAAAAPVPTMYVEAQPSGRFWVLLADGAGHFDKRTDVLLTSGEAGDLIDGLLDELRGLSSQVRLVQGSAQIPLTNMIERTPREELSLEALLTGTPPASARLTQLVGLKPIAYIGVAAAAALVVAGVVAHTLYQRAQEAAELEAARQAAIAQQVEAQRLATLTQIRIAEAVKRAIDEDTRTVSPIGVIANCLSAFREVGTSIAGWRVASLECEPTGTQVRVSLEGSPRSEGARPAANNATLFSALRARGWEPSIDSAQTRAVFTVTRTPVPTRPGLTVDALPRAVAVQEFVMPRFQRAGARSSSYAPRFDNPTERPITYVDPQLEHDTGNPQRFKPVPPEHSYRVAKLTIVGDDARALQDVALHEPIFTLTTLRLEPTQGAQAKFVMEANYVLARS